MGVELLLVKLTPKATKGLLDVGPVKRAEYFRGVVEAGGGKVLSYYLASGGEWDIVAIVDSPSDDRNPAGFLKGQAAGQWVRNLSVNLYRPEEVEAALGSATYVHAPGAETE